MRAKPFGKDGEKKCFAVFFRPSLDAPGNSLNPSHKPQRGQEKRLGTSLVYPPVKHCHLTNSANLQLSAFANTAVYRLGLLYDTLSVE